MPPATAPNDDSLRWLSDALLSADFGLISTASLVVGVACASTERETVLAAAMVVLFSGSFSMAAEQYLSVSTEADRERVELARRRREIEPDRLAAHAELADHYVRRGLDPVLAKEVADRLLQQVAEDERTREELGLAELGVVRPLREAVAAAACFALGAALPLLVVLLARPERVVPLTVALSLTLLAVLAAIAARIDGASQGRAVARIIFWGALAMGVTAVEGLIFGAVT
jgi:VIT1/CCC1 family predicted Fe2+/Mn2+ transporter